MVYINFCCGSGFKEGLVVPFVREKDYAQFLVDKTIGSTSAVLYRATLSRPECPCASAHPQPPDDSCC